MRRFSSLVFLLAGLLLSAPAASAPPAVEQFEFDATFPDTSICGFPIELRFVGRATTRYFFDQKSGALERLIFTAPDTLTVTNPANDHVLTGHEVVTFHVDFTDGVEDVRVGIPFHVNSPGGPAIVEAGRLSFDNDGNVIYSGVARFTEGDLGTFCANLA